MSGYAYDPFDACAEPVNYQPAYRSTRAVPHDWRLISEERGEDGVTRIWYCTRCRRVDTLIYPHDDGGPT